MAPKKASKTTSKKTSKKAADTEPVKFTDIGLGEAKQQEQEDVSAYSSKAISAFDMIKQMFVSPERVMKYSSLMMERNAFMVNRVFAIAHPMQAQCFNNKAINLSDVVKSWNIFAGRLYPGRRVPGFIYTSGSKKAKDAAAKTNPILAVEEGLKAGFCTHFQLSNRDFEDCFQFFPDKLAEDIASFKEKTAKNYADTQILNK